MWRALAAHRMAICCSMADSTAISGMPSLSRMWNMQSDTCAAQRQSPAVHAHIELDRERHRRWLAVAAEFNEAVQLGAQQLHVESLH